MTHRPDHLVAIHPSAFRLTIQRLAIAVAFALCLSLVACTDAAAPAPAVPTCASLGCPGAFAPCDRAGVCMCHGESCELGDAGVMQSADDIARDDAGTGDPADDLDDAAH